MKKLRDKPGYSDTVLEGTDWITYHGLIYTPHALQEHIVECTTPCLVTQVKSALLLL
jgi:hypothetical protein